jgi:AraC-like DNA-binding protein
VLGAREHVRRKVPRGTHRSVSARLRLGACGAVLGVPGSVLAGRIVELEELWGDAAARRLLERLAAAIDGVAAAKILDAAIAERAAFARLARFQRALRAASADGRAAWAAIAAEAGYYDQAHLIAEFQAIAGAPPRALLGELRTATAVG